MKLFITLLKGILLAGGMVLLMGVVIGASGYLHEGGADSYSLMPYVAGMVVLALLGVILGRWVWPERKQAWKIIGVGFLCFMLFQLTLILLTSGNRGLAEVMESVNMMMWLCVLWFWLPFAIGVLIGGLRRKAEPAKLSEHPAVL